MEVTPLETYPGSVDELASDPAYCTITEDAIIARLAEIDAAIRYNEKQIDRDKQLYLMTWCPDPKKMPDCDFDNQHRYMAEWVQTYMYGCEVAGCCVETTQEGNPHYHLWYQLSDDYQKENFRIRWMKCLKSRGLVKVTKSRIYRIHKWGSWHNSLWYYKKDLPYTQLFTPFNPLSHETKIPKVDYSDYNMFFNIRGKKTSKQIVELVSEKKQIELFYKNSLTRI